MTGDDHDRNRPSVRSRAIHAAASLLGRRGFEVRRHPAARRQAFLAREGVDLVIDVGAADGGFGRQLRSFGYTGAIVSFEPQRGAFAALARTIAEDPLWTARRSALGPEAGEVTLNIASNSTSSSILPMLQAHRDAAPQVQYTGEEVVPLARLDDEVADLVEDARAPFLKIDTQGFEREVLAGGHRTLAASVGLQLELSLVPLYSGGMLLDEAVSWAYGHGFRLVGFEQGYAAPTGEILQMDGVFGRVDAQHGPQGRP